MPTCCFFLSFTPGGGVAAAWDLMTRSPDHLEKKLQWACFHLKGWSWEKCSFLQDLKGIWQVLMGIVQLDM